MTIDIRQLRYAVETCNAQSFSAAALALNVKQTTLSRSLQHLEDCLGIKLFERTTRGAEPTLQGKAFIEQARRIVTDVDSLWSNARKVSSGLSGHIAVGHCSPLTAGHLKMAIAEYLNRFPDVAFSGVEARPEQLVQDLQSRSIDVAVAPIGLADEGWTCNGFAPVT